MIVAAAVTLVLGNASLRQYLGLSKVAFTGNEPVVFAKTLLFTLSCTTVAWVVATFLTPAESEQKLIAFYRRVGAPGAGREENGQRRPPSCRGGGLRREAFLLG